MKKVILIPDSFKGTLSSSQICEIMRAELLRAFPSAKVLSVPVADGGEGSVDCFLSACGGEKVFIDCKGPYMEDIRAYYGVLPDGTAVVETASAAGLPMVEGRANPLKTTTYGVGQLLLHAVKAGAKRIVLGLGGSCTNDFGCGAACACGARFFDSEKNAFIPTGETLCRVAGMDLTGLDPAFSGVEIVAMCDVDNPPYGAQGAARVFAPQKGADGRAVEILDEGVRSVCAVIKKSLGLDLDGLQGGGAAGAFGAGATAFFGAKLQAGIDTVLQTVGFDGMLENADCVFTSEGKLDAQSLRGKVVVGVAKACKRAGVPVVAVVGGADADLQGAYEAGVTAVFPINRLPQDLSVSKRYSAENLAFTTRNILRLMGAKKC